MFSKRQALCAALAAAAGSQTAHAQAIGGAANRPVAVRPTIAPTPSDLSEINSSSKTSQAITAIQECAAAAAEPGAEGRLRNAKCVIDAKWGVFGIRKLGEQRPNPLADSRGLYRWANGWYSDFANGRVYTDENGRSAAAVIGPIYQAFIAAGGDDRFGPPLADEEKYDVDSAAGGKVSRFAKGAIFWWSDTGAVPIVAHQVYGEIVRFYAAKGGAGHFGQPVGDEDRLSDGTRDGRFTQFEKGRIGWFPETGAFEITKIRVTPVALHVFGETDHDGGSDSDEYVVTFGALGDPRGAVTTLRAPDLLNGLNTGATARLGTLPVFEGAPNALQLVTLIAERDYGDPNRYKGLITGILDARRAALAMVVGSAASPAAGALVSEILKPIDAEMSEQLSTLLDTGDDVFDPQYRPLSMAELLTFANSPKRRFEGVDYDFESDPFRKFGATLKVYYRVDRGDPMPAP